MDFKDLERIILSRAHLKKLGMKMSEEMTHHLFSVLDFAVCYSHRFKVFFFVVLLKHFTFSGSMLAAPFSHK